MTSFHRNSAGGLSYATQQQTPGLRENRSEALADVRMVVDGLQELCDKLRNQWPERYPMPEDLDALLCFQEYALAKVRAGTLRHVAEGER